MHQAAHYAAGTITTEAAERGTAIGRQAGGSSCMYFEGGKGMLHELIKMQAIAARRQCHVLKPCMGPAYEPIHQPRTTGVAPSAARHTQDRWTVSQQLV